MSWHFLYTTEKEGAMPQDIPFCLFGQQLSVKIWIASCWLLLRGDTTYVHVKHGRSSKFWQPYTAGYPCTCSRLMKWSTDLVFDDEEVGRVSSGNTGTPRDRRIVTGLRPMLDFLLLALKLTSLSLYSSTLWTQASGSMSCSMSCSGILYMHLHGQRRICTVI